MFTKSIILITTIINFNAMAVGFPLSEKEILFYVSDTIVPSKVKAHEEVKAVVSGFMPNSCYSYSRSKVEKDEKGKEISISTFAIVRPGTCLSVIVPFTKEVKLGTLEYGEYKVKFLGPDETSTEKTMIVE